MKYWEKEKEKILKKIKERIESGFYVEKEERVVRYKKIEGFSIKKRKEIKELEDKMQLNKKLKKKLE